MRWWWLFSCLIHLSMEPASGFASIPLSKIQARTGPSAWLAEHRHRGSLTANPLANPLAFTNLAAVAKPTIPVTLASVRSWKGYFSVPLLSRILSSMWRELNAMTRGQKALLGCGFFLGFCLGWVKVFWRPAYRTPNDVPSYYFGPKAPPLFGKALSISDGDTFRFYHTPLCWLSPFLPDPLASKKRKVKVSEVALPVRICTMDTPETAKFGKPGQAFGKEAKQALLEMLPPGKVVKIRLLARDQYGRVVAQVYRGWGPFRQYVDELMLKKGLAEVYTGGGAVYGPLGVERYLEIEEKAREKKLGIWSNAERESAAAYKKRTKT